MAQLSVGSMPQACNDSWTYQGALRRVTTGATDRKFLHFLNSHQQNQPERSVSTPVAARAIKAGQAGGPLLIADLSSIRLCC
ncbi:hypothetical protein [Pseudomonas savastanoi]|uniref:hypothetical protein n=1 Tax=Pseudomonas savastanoi TaxID=29438 RepID=UPI00111020B6|nr:hypothetical protein [Pseudomonas savastanoi]MCQ3005075.1 hypothetical protein [Pseudomonas savastanoi]